MSWGVPRRPKFSNKLGIPTPREGSDGDIQVRQTNLGAKLFGKIGGRWKSTFLSNEDEIIGTSGTKIGMDSSGAFTVDQILLNGKITLSSTGTQNVCIGTGNSDVSGAENNISIGVDAGNALESGATLNILIGTSAGKVLETGDSNTCIGTASAPAITTGGANTCIGYSSGSIQATGAGGLYIGHRAAASASNVDNEGVIAVGSLTLTTVGRGEETIVLGHEAIDTIYMNRNGTANIFCGTANIGGNLTAPANTLQISHTSADGDQGILIINPDATTVADGALLGAIGFDSADGAIPSSLLKASCFIAAYSAEAHSSGDKGGDLAFGCSLIDENENVTSTEHMRISDNGAIGMGTSTPGFVNGNDHSGGGDSGQLHLKGNVPQIFFEDEGDTNAQWKITGQEHFYLYDMEQASVTETLVFKVDNGGDTWTNDGSITPLSSDIRVKKDIETCSFGLDEVNKLLPKFYKFNGKSDTARDDDIKRVGFIADDIVANNSQAFQDFFVNYRTDTIDGVEVDNYKSLGGTRILYVMVNAIQELSTKIDTMQTEINNLK